MPRIEHLLIQLLFIDQWSTYFMLSTVLAGNTILTKTDTLPAFELIIYWEGESEKYIQVQLRCLVLSKTEELS